VTDVETCSTASPGGTLKRSIFCRPALVGVVVTFLFSVLLAAPRPVEGDPLANARAQASQIAAQIQADATRVDVLSQQYEVAQAQVQSLDNQIAQIRGTIASDQAKVQTDQKSLRQEAIDAYMTSGNNVGVASLFAGDGQNAVLSNEYNTEASDAFSTTIDQLNVAQKALDTQQQQLQLTQAQAQGALNQVSASQQEAEAAVSSQEATLSQVKGQIATLVAQQQAAQQAAQHAAFVQRVSSSNPATNPNLPAAGGAATAVAAAESQLGVPYVWGGVSPGVGFDCSGLTQWSWSRAGVGIPRTAQAQYDAIPHVSLGSLEPGDLLFWGSGPGGVSHTGMYVGGGDVIDAPYTGTVVQIQPIWNSDLVGAGRP
jgi:cell wall-associated NlpC family hydrolase